MNKTKHTPGPWKIGKPCGLGTEILDSDNSGIAIVADEANARLIAEAPDLLEVLCKAETFLPEGWVITELVRAAIARVTGE